MPITVLFIAVSMIGLTVSVCAAYPHACRHDFLGFYAAASLAREGGIVDIHEPAILLARQKEVISEVETVVLFSRPPLYAVILAPISLLSYHLAFSCWLLLNSVALLACWIWGVRRFGYEAAVFGALYPPAVLGIAHGQDCVLMLGLAIGAYLLAKGKQEVLSGVVLGLGLVKFHLFLLWPLALMLRRKWRMLAGFSAAGTLLGLGTLASGWTGLWRYMNLLSSREMEALYPSPYKQVSIWGLLENCNVTSVGWVVVLAAVWGLAALFGRYGQSLEQLFASTISGSLAVAPHVYGYDVAILLLPLWLTMFYSPMRAARRSARLLTTPIPYAFLWFAPPLTAVTSVCILAHVLLQSGLTSRSRATS